MAKLLVGVLVFCCASVVLLAVGQSGGGRGTPGVASGELPASSPVMLAFTAGARTSRISQVFLVREDGSTNQLTHERLHLEVADWSADARQILVVAATAGGEALAVVSATTGQIRLIRRFRGFIQAADWSPTSDRIAFEWNGHPFTVDPQGGHLQDLAPAASHTARGASSAASGVSWASDGTLIAASATLRCGRRILVIGPRPRNVSGGCPRSRPHATYDDVEPSWSPAGGYIAFTRQRRNHSSLYHVDLASSQPTRYRLGDVEGPRSPAWSPRASPPLLAFRSTLGVYVYDRRHATPTRLSSISPLTGPVWSNDATRVAYLTNRGTFNSAGELVIAAIHGGRTLRIAHFSPTYLDPIGQPAWRPPTEPR